MAKEGPTRRVRSGHEKGLAKRLAKLSDVGQAVRLTVVPDEGEAEILCRLLRAEGIACAYRTSDLEVGGYPPGGYTFGGWREILVDADDLARARQLLPEKQG